MRRFEFGACVGVLLALGCGEMGTARHELAASNGLILNGLVINGLPNNGLTTNGLASSGLVQAALGSAEFGNWFTANDESFSNMVMTYVVKCAALAGTSLTWTSPSTSTTYTWVGELGLAPYWAGGSPIREDEQQLVTACLAASVNKFYLHVTVSLLGRTAAGALIPVGAGELETYSQREACFFGNLFNGAGALVGPDAVLPPQQSSVRACSLHPQSAGESVECPPMVYTASCASLCTFDPVNAQYTECTYMGTQYRPITTRIRPQDIYLCGDGICQVSESCGTGNTYSSCQADCGTCP